MKRIIVSVTNDLVADNRVHKVCTTLTEMGFDVLLAGRCYHSSPQMAPRVYKTRRMHLLFRKGPQFYAEYNLRLMFFLLFTKCDILLANDLDTLPANIVAGKKTNATIKKIMLFFIRKCFCNFNNSSYCS